MNLSFIQNIISKLDNNSLTHYESAYYDPEKAHEYYMQNRQLKGRTTSGLSDEGKEVWTSTKANIDSEKKNRIKEYELQKEIDVKKLRDDAEKKRTEISDKLKKLAEALSAKYSTDSKNLSKEQKSELAAIGNNPNLTKEQKAEKRAKIMDEFSKDREKLSTDRKTESSKNSTEAKTERTMVATELKAAIQNARDVYTKNKESLNSSYENVYQDEYDKIKSQYQAVKKTGGRKKSK